MDSKTTEKIKYEIDQLNKLLHDARFLLAICKNREPDFIERSAAALLLHSFYNGIENIIIIIFKSLEETEKESDKWHKSLLDRSFQNTSKRSRVFSEGLKDELGEYLSFRHFVRHSYGFQIVWDKMKPLIVNIEAVWEKVKIDLTEFLRSSN